MTLTYFCDLHKLKRKFQKQDLGDCHRYWDVIVQSCSTEWSYMVDFIYDLDIRKKGQNALLFGHLVRFQYAEDLT